MSCRDRRTQLIFMTICWAQQKKMSIKFLECSGIPHHIFCLRISGREEREVKLVHGSMKLSARGGISFSPLNLSGKYKKVSLGSPCLVSDPLLVESAL